MKILVKSIVILWFTAQGVISAQNIKVLHGVENKIDTKKAEFSLIGSSNEKLILLEKNIDNLRAEFYLHLYDTKDNFKLVKRVKLDLGEKELKGFIGIGWIEIVDSNIYAILINKSKDETQKKYFANSLDLNLKQNGIWKELLNLKLPGFKRSSQIMDNDNRFLTNSFFDWQDLRFHYGKKVLSIKDESIPKKAGSSFSTPICFDLNFNEVACPKNNFKSSSPSEYKEYPFLLMTRKITYSKDNFIVFSVRSNKDEYSSQNKAKHSVNLILVNKDSSYGYRNVAQLPKGYEIKVIDGYYNSVKDIVLFYVLYKEKKDRKNEYSGILIIKYDLNTEKIVSEVFNSFKSDIKEKFKKSLIWEKLSSFRRYNFYYSFKTTSTIEGEYRVTGKFVYKSIVDERGTKTKDVRVKETKNILADIVYFEIDENSEIKNMTVINKFYENGTALEEDSDENSYLVFRENDKRSIIFPDIKKNYTNGVYNGNNEISTSSEDDCLSIVSGFSDGNTKRKIFVNSLDELGVVPRVNCVIKEEENKYICFGFYNGTAKFLTFKID